MPQPPLRAARVERNLLITAAAVRVGLCCEAIAPTAPVVIVIAVAVTAAPAAAATAPALVPPTAVVLVVVAVAVAAVVIVVVVATVSERRVVLVPRRGRGRRRLLGRSRRRGAFLTILVIVRLAVVAHSLWCRLSGGWAVPLLLASALSSKGLPKIDFVSICQQAKARQHRRRDDNDARELIHEEECPQIVVKRSVGVEEKVSAGGAGQALGEG